MSEAYEEFKRRLIGRTDVAHGRGVGPEAIAAAERALGPLPADYKALLAEFGWLELAHFEILGLGDDVPGGVDVVSDVVRINRYEHDEEETGCPLPAHLVAVHPIGNGDYDCVDTRIAAETGDSPVFAWTHELPPEQAYWETEPTFAAYLHRFLDWLDENREDG